MGRFNLPNELFLVLAGLADAPTVAALACASRQLHDLLNPILYRRNVKEGNLSALWWAAENGRIDTAKLCLSNGADINSALPLDEEGQVIGFLESGTALHYAVRAGQDDFVEYLLDNGADHQRWCTHLCECIAPMGRAATRRHGADAWTSHWSPLHLALCKGHTSTAKILIDRRVSCEMTCQVSWKSGQRAHELRPSTFNVVHEIAIHKNVDILDYMIDNDYPLGLLSNAVTFNGNTPLHHLAIAHSWRSFKILSRLLNSVGPNINVPNNDLLTPLECFVRVGAVRSAQVLLSLGSRPRQINNCILSAAGIRIQESDSLGHEIAERRNELVLCLLNYALSAGSLTQDVKNQSSARTWFHIFYIAFQQPALLQRLLDEGFKPTPWGPRHTFLSGMVKYLLRDKGIHADLERPFFYESIRLLTRAGERWDERGSESGDCRSALERLVLVNYSRNEPPVQQLRETLIGCLLEARPPEETIAEQAHFDGLCRYALDRGDKQTYNILVRYAAEGSSFYEHPGFQPNAGTRASTTFALV